MITRINYTRIASFVILQSVSALATDQVSFLIESVSSAPDFSADQVSFLIESVSSAPDFSADQVSFLIESVSSAPDFSAEASVPREVTEASVPREIIAYDVPVLNRIDTELTDIVRPTIEVSSHSQSEDLSHTNSLRREFTGISQAQATQTSQQQQAPQQQVAQTNRQQQAPQSFTKALLQSQQLKIVVSQAATPTIQNHKNIEDTLSQLKHELKREGIEIESIDELMELAEKDQSIINMTNEEKAILYALSMKPLSTEERNENNRQIENITQKQEVAKYATETIHRAIGNRIDELGLNNLAIGVSAGDESTKKIQGIWVKGTYSSSKKGSDKDLSGYKGNSIVGTLGVDFELNDQNILGLAYSNMKSDFKYNSAGNKISGDSHILSLYSSHQLNDALMLKTMFSVGINKINTQRLAAENIATGKIKNRSYSAETNLGYKINTNHNLFITPNIGLRYANYKDSAYSESGAGVHNISVKAKSNNTFSTTAGVNIMMHKKASETLLIVPSIHASIESHLNNNKDKVKSKFAWIDNYFENSIASKKSEKFNYNLGGGIAVKQNNNLEVSVNYNCNLYNKYQNHQGSIKLKILL